MRCCSTQHFGQDDPAHGSGGVALDRRFFIGGALALGSTFLAGPSTAAPAPHRIDVHHHIIPPQYVNEAPPSGASQRGRAWTPQKSIEEMDRNGVAVSMLSFSTPSYWHPGVEPGRRLARMCNDYSAEMQRDHPGRFGLFAGVPPLDDTEGCLREIEYAYGTLNADGITVMTNYSGSYLGKPAYAPVWEELNRRGAVVYVHPADPACCMDADDGVPPGYLEWPFDTARTVMSLWTGEVVTRWPRIRFILSHGGGGLAMIADRADKFGRQPPGTTDRAARLHDAMAMIRTLYFDTANAANPPAFAATRALAAPGHILFGSDYPYVPISRTADDLARASLSPKERLAIDRGNALAILPTNGWAHRGAMSVASGTPPKQR